MSFYQNPLLALAVDEKSEAYRQGEWVGGALVMILIILGVVKCVQIMLRPNVSRLGVGALLAFLMCFAVSSFLVILQKLDFMHPAFSALLALAMFALLVLSFVLGVIALFTYDRQRFVQGRAQAIWAVSLSSLMILTSIGGAVAGFIASREVGEKLAGVDAPAITGKDGNFTVSPGKGWRSMKNPTGNEAIKHFLRHSSPELYCSVIPERLGVDKDTAWLKELSLENLKEGGTVLSQKESKVTVGGLEFARVVSRVKLDEQRLELVYEHWMLARKGFAWQFIFWSHPSKEKILAEKASLFMQSFKLLDPDLDASGQASFKDVRQESFGFATKLAGRDWAPFAEANYGDGLCSFAALHGDERLLVIPVRFYGQAPDLDALVSAFSDRIGVKLEDEEAKVTPDWKPGGELGGREIQLKLDSKDNGLCTYVVRVVRGPEAAWAVVCWAPEKKSNPALMRSHLDRIELFVPKGAIPAPSKARTHSLELFLNDCGIHYVQMDRREDATLWFLKAFHQTESDPVILSNASDSLHKGGKIKEARELLLKHPELTGKNLALQFQLAKLHLEENDNEAGQKCFLELIAKGYRDEEGLLAWMTLLNERELYGPGLDVLNAWVAKQPSIRTRIWHAQQKFIKGDESEAIVLFEKLAEENPENESVLVNLGEHCNRAGNYLRSAEAAQKLLDKRKSFRALMILGWSQMGRKWYRDAKATFEQAASLAQDNADVKDAIREASSMLGQGDNSSLKTPIEPVAMPSEVSARLRGLTPPADFEKDQPAVWLLRSTGWSVSKEGRTRRTVTRRVKVLDSEAASSFSSVEIKFDPMAERMFINRLEVRDEKGVVAKGRVEDAYVRDDTDGPATNDKVLHMQVPGVQPGRVIEWEVTFESLSNGPMPFDRHLFSVYFPSASEALFFTGDLAALRFETTGGRGLEEVGTEGLRAWVSGARAPVRHEAYTVPLEAREPFVWFGPDKGGWDKVAASYLSDIRDRLEPDASLAGLVKELTAGCADDRAKVAALARHVQREVSYKAIEFGVRARRPNAAGETLRLRYGDCKDVSLLLHQLLRAAGVASHLALCNTDWSVRPGLPSLDQFNHMIVHVPCLGPDWLVDVTDKSLDLAGHRADRLWHAHALILDAASPRLIAPSGQAEATSCRVSLKRTATLAEGSWKVDEVLSGVGYYASPLRSSYQGMSPEKQLQRAQGYLGSLGPARLDTFRFEDLNDTARPARLNFSYTLTGAQKAGGREALVPALFEKDYLSTVFVKERQTAFESLYPMSIETELKVILPRAPTKASLASLAQKGDNAYVTWKLTAEAEGATATLRFTFQAKAVSQGKESYPAFHEAWEKARQALEKPIEWEE